MKIKIKPLSVNTCWQGKRFKTKEYLNYERNLLYLLPCFKIPFGKILLEVKLGLSNKNSDWDNPLKPFVDILQKRYGFNDKLIYKAIIEKQDVKKGEEYIEFEIKKYE